MSQEEWTNGLHGRNRQTHGQRAPISKGLVVTPSGESHFQEQEWSLLVKGQLLSSLDTM